MATVFRDSDVANKHRQVKKKKKQNKKTRT